MKPIWIVDDDQSIRFVLEKALAREQFATRSFSNPRDVLAALDERLRTLEPTKVQLDGALCRCGQRGCIEAYVADYALAREATTALNWGHKESQPINVLLESLYDHAKAGNVTAKSIFRRAGRYLALGLSNVVNLFDPALIILSGERMRYDYLYAAETLAECAALLDADVLDGGGDDLAVDAHLHGPVEQPCRK